MHSIVIFWFLTLWNSILRGDSDGDLFLIAVCMFRALILRNKQVWDLFDRDVDNFSQLFYFFYIDLLPLTVLLH